MVLISSCLKKANVDDINMSKYFHQGYKVQTKKKKTPQKSDQTRVKIR